MDKPIYSSQTSILPLTTIRCERMLPWQGEVLVSIGQKVEPSDVVARAGQPRPFLILNLPGKLRISPAQAEQAVVKAPGEPVQQGETLAIYKEGLFGTRKITSPVVGQVLAIKAGRMLIQPRPDLFELRASITGLVASTSSGFGVTIETPGALIQTTWGSGKESYGVLKMGVSQPDAVLVGEQLDVAHHGSILVCGSTLDMNLLEKAQELQVRGLIVGGVPAELMSRIRQELIQVVATEGIGRMPISSTIFNLLEANQGREATLLAKTPQRWQSSRPEIIIPLPTSATPPPSPSPGLELSPGLKVRVKRAPYKGMTGTVKVVYSEPHPLESGISYPGADIVLEDGTAVFAPYVNLDVIGSN